MDIKLKRVCAAVSAAIAAHYLSTLHSTSMAVSLAAAATITDKKDKKKSGRYKRHGAIPHPRQLIWMRVDDRSRSDDLEFFMFFWIESGIVCGVGGDMP